MKFSYFQHRFPLVFSKKDRKIKYLNLLLPHYIFSKTFFTVPRVKFIKVRNSNIYKGFRISPVLKYLGKIGEFYEKDKAKKTKKYRRKNGENC